MKKLILFAALAAGVATAAKAQLAFGPEVGLNFSSSSVDDTSSFTDISKASKTGFRIGAIVDLGFTKKLSLQPGIFYSIRGSKNVITANAFGLSVAVPTETVVNYLEIPVNIQYQVVDVKVAKVFVGAGPYFSYALSGKQTTTLITETTETMKFGSDTSSHLKPTDFGVNINAGAMLGMGLFARLQYGIGLANIAPIPEAATIKNGNFSVTVGYLFGRKR